jgi:hypothetical protein
VRLQHVYDCLLGLLTTYTKKQSRFLQLGVAREHLNRPTSAHCTHRGAFRVLADMWNVYNRTVKRLRKLCNNAPKYEAAAR